MYGKWQYRREKFLKQEEIKDVPMYGSWICPVWLSALNAASITLHTVFVRLAEPTEARKSLRLTLSNPVRSDIKEYGVVVVQDQLDQMKRNRARALHDRPIFVCNGESTRFRRAPRNLRLRPAGRVLIL